MRIRVQGDNVQTWLNGEEMVNIRDEKIGAGQGRIALQIHDGGGIKVLWRNLHLKTLKNIVFLKFNSYEKHFEKKFP